VFGACCCCSRGDSGACGGSASGNRGGGANNVVVVVVFTARILRLSFSGRHCKVSLQCFKHLFPRIGLIR